MMVSPFRRLSRATLVVAVTLGSLAVVGPAAAEKAGFKDERGDMGHKIDVLRVRVVNEQAVRVRVRHDNLTRRGSHGASVYLDTNFKRRGPEYVFVAGLSAGTDFVLLRARRWKVRGEPLDCPYDLALDFKQDVSVFKVSRDCLRDPRAIRVGVQVVADTDTGAFTDWLVERRHLTRRVARG